MLFNRRLFCFLLLCGILIVLSVTPLSANIARMESMGLQGDSYWALQKDEAYIHYNPAHLAQFTPRIFADPVNQIGGLMFTPVNNVNLFLTTGRPLFFLDYPGYDFLLDPDNAPLTKEQINLTGSYNMGNMAFGAGASYAGAEDKDSTAGADYSYTRSVMNFRGGFFMDLGQGKDFDAAIHYTKWDVKDESLGNTNLKASTNDISVLGRFNMSISEISRLHIFGTYQMIDRSEKEPDVGDNYTIIGLGVSDEMNITKSTIVYAATGFVLGKEKIKANDETYNMDSQRWKVSAGVETDVKGLKGRFGFNRYWYYFDKNGYEDTTILEEKDPEFAFGLGWKIGNINLDWQIAQSLVQHGPYFISGVAGNTSTQFEVSYHFETGSEIDIK